MAMPVILVLRNCYQFSYLISARLIQCKRTISYGMFTNDRIPLLHFQFNIGKHFKRFKIIYSCGIFTNRFVHLYSRRDSPRISNYLFLCNNMKYIFLYNNSNVRKRRAKKKKNLNTRVL